MIRNKRRISVRFFLAAAVGCVVLAPSTGVRAQEPSFGSSHGGVRAFARPATARAVVRPSVTMRHQWTGEAQEEFRLDIRFSQDVTGFTDSDIDPFGAELDSDGVERVGNSERWYRVTMYTRANYEGPVILEIPANAAENIAGEGNLAETYTFDADTRAPAADDAEVDGRELVVTFDEDLDESTVPSGSNFDVYVTRDGDRDDERVSRVEVDGSEVILTLARAVRYGDDIELFYDDAGTRALRDEAGNLAPPFDLPVENETAEGEAPGPPRNLTADADGASVIELNWSAPLDRGSSAITGYWIEVSTDVGATWSTRVRDTGSTATRYRHTGLSADTTLHYRVSAINSFDTGDASNVASATTEERVPNAPRGLTARARGTSAIELDWTAPSSAGTAPVTGYRIEWSRTGRSPWAVLEADTESTTTAYTHKDLSPGTTRHYRVAAISRVGRSAWSSVVHATTDVTTPGAPTGLRATASAVGGSTRLLLSWTRPSTDGGSAITGYRIETSPTGVAGWTLVAVGTTGTATTYVHTGLTPGTTRYYRVAAINRVGRSGWSNVAQGTTNAAPPGQPQSLRARGAGPMSITLTWDAPTSDGGARITGYRVRARGPGDGTWITIESNTRSTARTFTHTRLQPATAYRYQVAAINSMGAGAWSFEAGTSTHPDVPGAPFNLTARAVGTSRIDLSWSAPRNTGGAPILGYRIEASIDAGGTWRIIRRNTGSAATTFADVNLQPATTRHYRVAAINTAGTGPFSNYARATTDATLPGVPRTLVAEADGTSRIELSWRAPTSDGGARVTGYRIEVSEDGGASWRDLVGNTRTTGTTYVHAGLEPATTRHYCYRARQITGSWALKMSGLSPVAGVRPWDVGRRRARAENGLATIASPLNEGDVMIGRETRVLLRHYLEQGLSKAAVARRCGVSERTVYRWIAAGQLDRELDDGPVRYGPRRPRPSRLDPYKEIIETRLARYPDLSAVRLFEEIRKAGYEGGYDQVKRHVREVRPLPEPEPVRRFETPPGHQGQVDFAEFKTPWGKRHALVVVLGYSRLMWVRYYERQTMAVVMEGLESAFRYFGGVPSELLFDQMKAVIVEDNREVGGRLMENTEFLRFAHHWGFRIRACRPYRAQTKGKVERPVSYIRRSFFYGRDFVSDDDLNARVLGWLGRVANVRVHGTLKERPVDRFEAERPHLKPLARWPYRPVTPLRPEPSKERNEAAADSRFVEVERRPLAEYGRIAGGVR